MTREEAINRYDRIRYNLTNSEDKEAVDIAFEALREQEGKDINVTTKWISVEERLPEPYTKVLVWRQPLFDAPGYVGIDNTMLCHGGDIMWHGNLGSWKSVVTHWMPLPEPPEVEV